MAVVHSFLALLAGFAVMAAIVIAVTAVLQKLVPAWVGPLGGPRPAYVVTNMGYSFLAAMAGGYITAWIAGAMAHVLALAIVVLVLGALSALQTRGKQPVWYQLALLAISPLGVVAGGLLRLKSNGLL